MDYWVRPAMGLEQKHCEREWPHRPDVERLGYETNEDPHSLFFAAQNQRKLEVSQNAKTAMRLFVACKDTVRLVLAREEHGKDA